MCLSTPCVGIPHKLEFIVFLFGAKNQQFRGTKPFSPLCAACGTSNNNHCCCYADSVAVIWCGIITTLITTS